MNGERGFAFMWVMFLVVLVGATSSILFTRSSTLLANADTNRVRARSFWAAEGGLEATRHALAADAEYAGGTALVGKFRAISEVTRTESGWRVEVRATPGGARLEVELMKGESLPRIARWRQR